MTTLRTVGARSRTGSLRFHWSAWGRTRCRAKGTSTVRPDAVGDRLPRRLELRVEAVRAVPRAGPLVTRRLTQEEMRHRAWALHGRRCRHCSLWGRATLGCSSSATPPAHGRRGAALSRPRAGTWATTSAYTRPAFTPRHLSVASGSRLSVAITAGKGTEGLGAAMSVGAGPDSTASSWTVREVSGEPARFCRFQPSSPSGRDLAGRCSPGHPSSRAFAEMALGNRAETSGSRSGPEERKAMIRRRTARYRRSTRRRPSSTRVLPPAQASDGR
jgi:hypothetical protein